MHEALMTEHFAIIMLLAAMMGFTAGLWGGMFVLWRWIDYNINQHKK